jgi:hypothetical protein
MTSYSPIIVATLVMVSLDGCATPNQTTAHGDRVIATSSEGAVRNYEGPMSGDIERAASRHSTRSTRPAISESSQLWNHKPAKWATKFHQDVSPRRQTTQRLCGMRYRQRLVRRRIAIALPCRSSRVTPAAGGPETKLTAYAEDHWLEQGTLVSDSRNSRAGFTILRSGIRRLIRRGQKSLGFVARPVGYGRLGANGITGGETGDGRATPVTVGSPLRTVRQLLHSIVQRRVSVRTSFAGQSPDLRSGVAITAYDESASDGDRR